MAFSKRNFQNFSNFSGRYYPVTAEDLALYLEQKITPWSSGLLDWRP
jgi:hypothetical protein